MLFFFLKIDRLEEAASQCKIESIKEEYELIAKELNTKRLIDVDIIRYFENSSVGIDRKDVRESHRF